MKEIIRYLKDEEGPTFAEYAVLTGLMVLLIVVIVKFMGDKIKELITNAFDRAGTGAEEAGTEIGGGN